MNYEDLLLYCSAKPGVTDGFPFGEPTLVFKVMGKMFAACSLDETDPRVNLKCDPERALELRESYSDIIPGWHMNKKHWNTVYMERELTDETIHDLIDHSYDLVVAKLPKQQKQELEQLKGSTK
ncbi:MAG: MmcQ/YjbR family DNA-binding protein [Bacteroidota bacterium]